MQGNLRGAVENALAKLRGNEGIAGDQGGHLAAFRFFKEQGLKNLFPQNGNFNTSAFKKLENDYAAALKVKGTEIKFSHKLSDFDANGRPSVVSVNSAVYRDGKFLAPIKERFDNTANQIYVRIFDKTGKLKP